MERNDRVYILHAVDAAEKALEISGRIQRILIPTKYTDLLS